MIEFPSDEEILEFTAAQDVGDAPAVLRDLARIATIFHLQEEGFLDGETVLAGGMALRCYGGHRFTIFDVDTSSKAKVKMGTLDDLLNWTIDDELEVSTAGVAEYERRPGLEKARPIVFDPLFSEIALGAAEAQFELTVNMRGLDLDPVECGFQHHFPWQMGVEGRPLPLMNPVEMLAEKVLGYCINVLGKHYADVAFLAFQFRVEMAQQKPLLRRLVETKLERGRSLANGPFGIERYALFPNVSALRDPLAAPEKHLGGTEFETAVRFVTSGDGKGRISLRTAKQIVRQYVIPWLFD